MMCLFADLSLYLADGIADFVAAFHAECPEFHAPVHTNFIARPDLRIGMSAPILVCLVLPLSRRPQRPLRRGFSRGRQPLVTRIVIVLGF